MRNGIVSPQAIDMGIASIKLESSPAIIIKYIRHGNPQGGLANGPCLGCTQKRDALTDKPARELARGITGTRQIG